MSSPSSQAAQQGLPWPETYADLRSELDEHWGVAGAIYLVRQLGGGKSGALVYQADLNSRGFSGQAILKFDTVPKESSDEAGEGERHRLAFERTPDYAEAHLPRIVNTYARGEQRVILSTIAGRGLEYSVPWLNCLYDEQLTTARTVSRDILELWNRDYHLADGLRTPQELLRAWLDYRIDPDEGRIHRYVGGAYGLTTGDATFIFDGTWFPNPLAFVAGETALSDRMRLRAITGNQHGDLHGQNVLVARLPDHELSYHLIDLAMYEADQFLFYDHAYFELTHMLRSRESADPTNWLSILNGIGRHGGTGAVAQGDDLGLVQLVALLRRELFDWVDRHEGDRLSYMESQALLARVAAGLCFTHRTVSVETRDVAFLYAAQSLKDLLRHHGVDWPKYGPPIVMERRLGDAVAAVSSSPAIADAPRWAGKTMAVSDDNEPALAPDKQSVAVMAFENRGGDPDQDYFADGMTEELITELSRIDWLTVVSHGSTDGYRGQAADPRQVGRDLGVSYVVSGTVRRVGDTVRVTAHLADARSGRELWSEHYDRKLDDIFAVQDDIAAAIVANIDSEAKASEREVARRKRGPLGVWDLYQRSLWHLFRMTSEDDESAWKRALEAVRAAPDFADARAVLALIEIRRYVIGASKDPAKDLENAIENAKRALAANRDSALAHMADAVTLAVQGKPVAAIAAAEQGIQLNPSSANAHVALGGVLYWAGRSADALTVFDRALRFNPKDRMLFALKNIQALCNADLGNLAEAERLALEAISIGPNVAFGRLTLAVVLVRAGRVEEARASIDEACRLRPNFAVAVIAASFHSMQADQRDRLLDDLRTAGLPESSP